MRFLKRLTALFVFLCLATGAQAAWPEKPVHLVVPYPPGGNVDLAARIVADGLEKEFGQPFVVENRPGAGGMIAASHVIKSDKDGYTLFVAPNGPVLFSPLERQRGWCRRCSTCSLSTCTPSAARSPSPTCACTPSRGCRSA